MIPKVTHSYENADADGNRGIWIEYIECPNCGNDLYYEIGIENCPICNQELDWEVTDENIWD